MYSHSDAPGRLLSQEGVYQLTKDVRTFSEALISLKAVFLDDKSMWISAVKLISVCLFHLLEFGATKLPKVGEYPKYGTKIA